MSKIKMPKFGLTMEEGTIAQWLVQEGDAVQPGDSLAEIDTDKITNTLEAEYAGTVTALLVEEGDTVACGTVIMAVDDGQPDGASGQDEGQGMAPVEENKIPATEQKGTDIYENNRPGEPWDAPAITPRAAAYAAENGLSWQGIRGTGFGGAVTIQDLKNAGGKKQPASAISGGEVKMSGRRVKIAEKMMESLSQTAQSTMTMDMDVTRLTGFYKEHKIYCGTIGIKLSYTAFLVKAMGKALENHPKMLLQLKDGVLISPEGIHIGVAMDSADGLIVPVIKEANKKSLHEICREIVSLKEGIANNTVQLDALRGSSITLSNLGMFGVRYFTPVLNYPESVIIGAGKIQEAYQLTEDGKEKTASLYLSLTHDHRISDGADGARFLGDVQKLLIHFEELL